MKLKIILYGIIGFYFSFAYSQDFELRETPFIISKIVLKNTKVLYGDVRMASSVFDVRYKPNKDTKEEKIDYKTIDSLIINPKTGEERIFQYLPNNQDKFLKFVELYYDGKINFYTISSEPLNSFYSDFNRETTNEIMIKEKEKQKEKFSHINDDKLFPINNQTKNYVNIKVTFVKKFIQLEGNPKLFLIEKEKRFLKNSKEVIEKCPDLKLDLENEVIKLNDIDTLIKYLNEHCK